MRVTHTIVDGGLRARKRRATAEAIQREALRLVEAQGWTATTCEQIAAAAGVSSATLFRYFATKEDIVLDDVYDPLIARAVLARPAGETPLAATRGAFADALGGLTADDLEQARRRTALILSVPSLRARSREQMDSLVHHLSAALAERDPSAAPGSTEVVATALASAVGVAVERWSSDGGDLGDHVDVTLAALADLDRAPGDPT